jgi:hypothetical protein
MSGPLKTHLRAGLESQEERQILWPKLIAAEDGEPPSVHQHDDIREAAVRLVDLIKEESLLSTNFQIENFQSEEVMLKTMTLRILTVISTQKRIPNVQYLQGITNILVWTLQSSELSYYMLALILEKDK